MKQPCVTASPNPTSTYMGIRARTLTTLHRRDRHLWRASCVRDAGNRIAPSGSFNATEHPTAEWTLQELREALLGDQDHKFLLHDCNKTFSAGLNEEVENGGLELLRYRGIAPTANANV